MGFSDQLEKGTRTEKGTLIDQKLVDAVRADEAAIVVIQDNTKEVLEALNKAVAAGLEECGLKAERFAKEACPVDTGRLRNSITHAVTTDNTVYIGTNVEYAAPVEFGRNGKGGARFLSRAASDHADLYRSTIDKHLRK